MKKALIGAGGFAREILAHMKESLPCYVDDIYWTKDSFTYNIHPLSSFDPEEYEVLIAIGNPAKRAEVVNKLPDGTSFFTYIHHSAQLLSNDIFIGPGTFICANSILTTNIVIGAHCHLNLSTTIGHDTDIGDFFTTAPGAKISGNCTIGDRVYVGTNASVREKISICNDVTVGLNSGVVNNINEPGTYVGLPAKKIVYNQV